MTPDEARAKLRATLDAGGVIIGAGAGTGLSAKCAEAGGTDLIIIYTSGRYRMAGRGSLAGHAVPARVVDHDHVDAASLLALGRQAGAGAAADDRLAPGRHLVKLLQQCCAFKPGHRSPR